MRFDFLFLCLLCVSSESIAQTTLVKVIFTVEDFETRKGMSGALVQVRQTASTQPTLADGKVTFNNVPVGEIEYYIMKEGYQFETGRVNVSTEEKTNIFRIPISKIDDKKILVTGEVTDGEGRDVKDAWVEVKIADQVRTVTTDASGNYSADIAPSTKYPSSTMRIEVKKGDCKKTETVDIPRTNVVYKDFKLSCSGEDNGKSYEQPVTTARPKPEHFYEDNYFTIQFKECKRQGTNLQVKCVMTAKDKDQVVRFPIGCENGCVIAYDDNGNALRSSTVRVANTDGGSSPKLIKDLPTPLTMIFTELSESAKTISLLDVYIYSNNLTLNPKFRKIDIK